MSKRMTLTEKLATGAVLVVGIAALACVGLVGCITIPDDIDIPWPTNAPPPDVATTTTIPPVTTTTQPPVQGDLDYPVDWLGDNYGRATRDEAVTIRNAKRQGSTLRWSVSDFDHWPHKRVGDADCQGVACFFRWRDGRWRGGKFDWIRAGGQSSKTLENVYHGCNGHTVPADGEVVGWMLVSVDGKRRSNLIEGTW